MSFGLKFKGLKVTGLQRILKRSLHSAEESGLRFDRPLVIFQSDDWGRVGVRDRAGWDELRASGIDLGASPYDFYSLETAGDLDALRELLESHHDCVGRNPSVVMNFITANPDFQTCLTSPGSGTLPLIPLADGLPADWQRPSLLDVYRHGVRDEVFFPALHGLTHFCQNAVKRELDTDSDRGNLLRKLWTARTPYIYWRMPWIGYEYWDPDLPPDCRFLSLDEQRSAIRRAAGIFQELFSAGPASACAPGYRANSDTHAAWHEQGIRVCQNGPDMNRAPYFDQQGMLHTFRTIEIEPATEAVDIGSLLAKAGECFSSGVPAIVSIHSINFHSTLKNVRTPTLALLGEFLTALKTNWPDLLFINDADLFQIATQGAYSAGGITVEVNAVKQLRKRAGG